MIKYGTPQYRTLKVFFNWLSDIEIPLWYERLRKRIRQRFEMCVFMVHVEGAEAWCKTHDGKYYDGDSQCSEKEFNREFDIQERYSSHNMGGRRGFLAQWIFSLECKLGLQ